MGNFKRGGFGGGHRDGGFKGKGGGFDRGNRGGFGGGRMEMHQAVCAECGNECEVPFKPSGDRPVLCSMCFKRQGPSEPRREERRDFDRPRFEEKEMFQATCAECGKGCQVPFRPKPGRDIFCSDCFGKDSKEKNVSFDKPAEHKSANYDRQFDIMNSKLDKILGILRPDQVAAAKVVEVVAKKEAVKEVKVVEAKKADKKVEKKEEKKKPAKKAAKKK